eukprot:scaffold51380_cov34-Cyclotella_meneghiniana.AAC.1
MASWPRAWASLISCLAIPVVVMDSVAESCSPPPIIDHVLSIFSLFGFSAFRLFGWRVAGVDGTQNAADRDSSFNSIMAEVISDFLLKRRGYLIQDRNQYMYTPLMF